MHVKLDIIVRNLTTVDVNLTTPSTICPRAETDSYSNQDKGITVLDSTDS